MFIQGCLYGIDFLDSLANHIQDNLPTLEFDEIEEIIEANKGGLMELQEEVLLVDKKYKESEDPRVRTMIQLWKAAAFSGEEKSIHFAESAYELARIEQNDLLEFRALYRIGAEYYMKNQTPEALDYYYKCKDHLSQIDEIYTIKLNLAFGLVYVRLGNRDGAKEVFDKNLDFLSLIHISEPTRPY